MVQVICEKTGIQFEASSKRTKNHPTIMALLGEANRYGWYGEALDALKKGREQQFSTIEQFVDALREAEAAAKEVQANYHRAEYERKQAEQEARSQRVITNDFLRRHGYHWADLGFADDEEVDNSYTGPTPRHDWQLFSPDNRAVSVVQAMQELADKGEAFAKSWLVSHNIAEISIH